MKSDKIIAVATTVSVILLGIALIICSAHLYFTGGDQPYSRERVGDYLMILAVPSLITVALTVCGFVMHMVKGRTSDEKAPRTQEEQLESFSAWFDISAIEGEAAKTIKNEKDNRKLIKFITYSISALLLVLDLVYLCFLAEFTVENLNGDILIAFAISLPLSVLALAIHVPRVYLAEISCERELKAIKSYMKENPLPKIDSEPSVKKLDYNMIVRYVILGASVLFILLGVFNGGMADVLGKAVKICTECIGLG